MRKLFKMSGTNKVQNLTIAFGICLSCGSLSIGYDEHPCILCRENLNLWHPVGTFKTYDEKEL